MLKLQGKYADALRTFKGRLLDALGDRFYSMVVYGSVARGDATEDSDIDVLVLGKDGRAREKVLDVAHKVDFENDYETFITPIYLTMEEFEHRIKVGSPFIFTILKEGVVLHDDGTFKRIREKMFRTGR